MIMTEIDTDGDRVISFGEFLPLFHFVLVQVGKQHVLRAATEPTHLERFLTDVFTAADKKKTCARGGVC
jgi:hypothetical protein